MRNHEKFVRAVSKALRDGRVAFAPAWSIGPDGKKRIDSISIVPVDPRQHHRPDEQAERRKEPE